MAQGIAWNEVASGDESDGPLEKCGVRRYCLGLLDLN